MYRKTFVCLCRQTISRIYTIFNTVHAMSDINNIYQFQNIWRILTRVRAWTYGQTDRQTNRMHKHFSTLLESVKNKNKKNLYLTIFKQSIQWYQNWWVPRYLRSEKERLSRGNFEIPIGNSYFYCTYRFSRRKKNK